jgi:hypothetical protein
MFWKRFDPENAGGESQARLHLRQQVLSALEFATLGAYDLLPEEPATSPVHDANDPLDPAPALHRTHVVGGATDAASAAHESSTEAASVAAMPERHARTARRTGHTSIRAGSRCNAERHAPCAIAPGDRGTGSRRLHAVRRSRRPGRPVVREQPCTWAAWLAERQA